MKLENRSQIPDQDLNSGMCMLFQDTHMYYITAKGLKMTKNIDIYIIYQNIAIIIDRTMQYILRDISCDNLYLIKMMIKLYAFSIITGKIYDALYDNDGCFKIILSDLN